MQTDKMLANSENIISLTTCVLQTLTGQATWTIYICFLKLQCVELPLPLYRGEQTQVKDGVRLQRHNRVYL